MPILERFKNIFTRNSVIKQQDTNKNNPLLEHVVRTKQKYRR
jgi:hypothetical protein